ncbi:class I SAM-dependent methyltransferase [Paenibacillus ehimensis]|uniref:Class I SAM-dependent methyltransferase n=1 Tax=Paenibacillus ehimensis TaxID=79264 RepID=A0ABT8VGH0_9BACL|nr:class I SAM-dependent methyltransferase [Paenibacillus ehimensis]MDO3680076.1 class I SAM-dependent methyltransferase [Paenibacillus ehimensis]
MSDAIYWNDLFSKLRPEQVKYDRWLEPFIGRLDPSEAGPILDLGCGAGNDTMYLTEKGYSVIACDRSAEALMLVQKLMPQAKTERLDLLRPLPFRDGSARAVVSDLSLHYFSWSDTGKIVAEISRVLEPGGQLWCRVNSTRDFEYGAGQGRLVEANYYELDGKHKRFFDRPQLEQLFQEWQVSFLQEQTMDRYDKPKVVWVLAATKPGFR